MSDKKAQALNWPSSDASVTYPDLLLSLSVEDIVQRVNPAWTKILGYESDELVGQYVHEFVWHEYQMLNEQALTEAASKPLENLDNRLRHKDGLLRQMTRTGTGA